MRLSFLGFVVHPVLLTCCVFGGCSAEPQPDPAIDPQPLTLRVLHINDHHSHLTPGQAELMLAGGATTVELGGFSRVVATFHELADGADNVLKLHAGDAITGDLFYTLFHGQADAALMNEVCFDAFALGNHEFDDGDAGLRRFLDHLQAGSCATDVLAANVVPEVGVSPLTPETATDSFAPYAVYEFAGQSVGVIGIDIAGKTKQSSNPDPTTEFLDETMTAQRYIDELREQGINKIILMTHYQYRNDLELAAALDGVDVIVGGDSHTLLGDVFTSYGLNAGGPYPTQVVDRSGNPVCIVQAWQYASVVGELNVEFDADGVVQTCEGTPHLLLGDVFTREDAEGEDVEVAGPEREAIVGAIEAEPALSIVTPDPGAEAVLAGYAEQVEALSSEVIGEAAADLCLERIPGQGYSQLCDVSQTFSHGSDITNLVARAFLEMSNTSDIALQNAGGVRVDVPAGDITIGTAYTLLPFANTLTEIDMRGDELVAVLEDAYEFTLEGSTGAFPYAAGLRWELDASKPYGQRFSNVEVNPRAAGQWQPLEFAARYRVVTNSYIAGGKDGYTTFAAIDDSAKVDTFLDYAQSFVDYVKREQAAGRSIDRLPLEHYSTQRFIDADGVEH